MKARLFDHLGVHVHTVEDVGKHPPPGWNWVDHEAFMEVLYRRTFAEPLGVAYRPGRHERRFDFVGVEVDNHGTWARYEESGATLLPCEDAKR
jgi:hypothetical protein